jgi:hypothetical protein
LCWQSQEMHEQSPTYSAHFYLWAVMTIVKPDKYFAT